MKVMNLSGCSLTGATWDDDYEFWDNIDSDMTGFVAFCGMLGKLEEINLGNCGLGPSSAAELAKAVSNAGADLNVLAVGDNSIGSEGGSTLLEARAPRGVPLRCDITRVNWI